jgi:addiction module RelE/StbE family toxin
VDQLQLRESPGLKRRLIIAPDAKVDIKRLVEFVYGKNKQAALAIRLRLLTVARTLVDHPELGRMSHKLDVRELIVAPYIIVYRIRPAFIDILHIYHGAEDRVRD